MTISCTIQTGGSQSMSIFGAMVKVHVRAYRAVCDRIENAASSVFRSYLEPPLSFGFSQARKVMVVDYCYTATLRIINYVGAKLTNEEVFAEDTRKTLKQKKREQQMAAFRERLGSDTIYPNFCLVTASYINEIIPILIAEKMGGLPGFAEGWTLYRLGIFIRYANYQVDKRTGYKEAAISSLYGQKVVARLNGFRSHAADFLVGKHNLEPLISFEHLLLNICVKLTSGGGREDLSGHLIRQATQSIVKSLENQRVIDQFINNLPLESSQEKFIARLEWHEKQGCLPKGLPNPVGLTPSNLKEELDHALTDRINGLVRALLERVAPNSLKKGVLGCVYYLEGKDFLVQLLGYLLSEFAVKQLVDPHLFALAILYASGEDVADFELDGFGRGKMDQVAFIGREMMKEALKPKASWEAIKKIFDSSKLKAAPGGLEGLMQKSKAKEKLKQFIAQFLYQMVKGENLHYDSFLKGVRERLSQLPLVGTATITLHGLINGMLFSLGYLFRNEEESKTTFLSWMVKNFSGREFYNFLAERIVDLIYHPNWRITLMQLIDDLEEVVTNPPPRQAPSQDPCIDVDLEPVADFLFQHFFKDNDIPFEENIAPFIQNFIYKGLKDQLQKLLEPSEDSALEKVLASLLPMMKEFRLYCRIVDSFRKNRTWFTGDQKFWEVFLRASLNHLTASRIMELKGPSAKVSLEEKVEIRNQFVEHMLKLQDSELRAFLSDIPECTEMLHHWEYMKNDIPEVVLMREGAGNQLSGHIIDNYIP